MNRKPFAPLRIAIAVVLTSLTGCSSTTPITLSTQFMRTSALSLANLPKENADNVCRVSLVSVRDTRSDTQSIGMIGVRPVRATDAAAWIRSGLSTLNEDHRIELIQNAAEADLVLDVELLRAYIANLTSDKTASVVIRIRYSGSGSVIGEQSYRGAEANWNWGSGEEETLSTLNAALAQIVEAVDHDVLVRCAPKSA